VTRARWRGEDGLSLIEALIAVAVLTVGLLGAAQLLAIAVQSHLLARETTTASRLATDKIEELMKANFVTDARVQVSSSSPDPLAQDVPNYFDVPTPVYTRRWQVQAGPTATTRLVTVRLVPAGRDVAMAKAVEVSTVIRQW